MSLPSDALSNPPQWLANSVRGIQIQLDNQYANAVSVYMGAVNNWIAAASRDREMNRTSAPFAVVKPVRYIAYAAQGDSPANIVGQVKQYADAVDPSLPDAVLPAPIKSAPTLGQSFLPALVAEGGGSGSTGSIDQLAAILAALERITKALNAVGIPV